MKKSTLVETGVFTRVVENQNKKRRQKTERLKKNPEKVVLCKFGDLELYCYPYSQPDRVYLGEYPNFTMTISKSDLSSMFTAYIKARWFLAGCWQNQRHQTKRAVYTSTSIFKAYDYGLKRLKDNAACRKKR